MFTSTLSSNIPPLFGASQKSKTPCVQFAATSYQADKIAQDPEMQQQLQSRLEAVAEDAIQHPEKYEFDLTAPRLVRLNHQVYGNSYLRITPTTIYVNGIDSIEYFETGNIWNRSGHAILRLTNGDKFTYPPFQLGSQATPLANPLPTLRALATQQYDAQAAARADKATRDAGAKRAAGLDLLQGLDP